MGWEKGRALKFYSSGIVGGYIVNLAWLHVGLTTTEESMIVIYRKVAEQAIGLDTEKNNSFVQI